MNGFLKTAGALATAGAVVAASVAGTVRAEAEDTVKAGVILVVSQFEFFPQ